MEHSDLGGKGKYAHWQIDNKLDEAATGITDAAADLATHAATYHPPLTATMGFLAAPVTMTNANTYYDGPTLTLPAGTWLLSGAVDVGAGVNTAHAVTAKLWDGTNVYASGGNATAGIDGLSTGLSTSLSAVRALSATTTVKISAADTTAGATLRSAAVNNGAGNNASYLTAVRTA